MTPLTSAAEVQMTRLSIALTAALLTVQVVGAGERPQTRTVRDGARLEAAINKELDGELQAAMADYRALSTSSDRVVASKALLRLADAHNKTGNAVEAARHYGQIVSQYGDQPAAETARTRQRAVQRENEPQTAGDRVVWSDFAVFGDGDVSPDGRLVSDTDFQKLQFIVRDLQSNTTRVLGEWTNGANYSSTFSPDGRQLAYGWRTYGDDTRQHVNEIRVVDVNQPGPIQPRRVYGNADISIFNALDWSPDGRTLLVLAEREDRTKQIALVGVHDGSYRGVKTVGWRGPNKMFFSPDGKYFAYDLPSTDTSLERDVFIAAVDGSGEAHVAHSSNDAVMGWMPTGELLFASDRSGAVGLWSLPVSNGRAAGTAALIKPDIGTMQSLGATKAGTLYLVRDASTQALYVAPVDLTGGKLAGPAVLQGFRSEYPNWSPDGKVLSHAYTTASGVRVMHIRSTDTGIVRELRPALTYFNRGAWLPDGTAVVVWGRDATGRGGIYRIDSATGQTSLVAESASISTVQVSPDGRKVYHNENRFTAGAGPARMVERDLVTGEVREVHRLEEGDAGGPVSPDRQWMASVVRGKTDSSLVIRPVAGGPARTLLTVTKPDDLEAFTTINWTPGSDNVLLARRTNGRPALWLVPINGDAARPLEIDVQKWGGSAVRLSPSGREIAFFSGDPKQELYELRLPSSRAAQ